MKRCPLCDWFAGPTLKTVVLHIGRYHAHQSGFSICCGTSGCPRTYNKFHSYRKHLYVHHRRELLLRHTGGQDTQDTSPTTDHSYLESLTIPPDDSVCDNNLAFGRRDLALFIHNKIEIFFKKIVLEKLCLQTTKRVFNHRRAKN